MLSDYKDVNTLVDDIKGTTTFLMGFPFRRSGIIFVTVVAILIGILVKT